MDPPRTLTTGKGQIPALDGLRAVAVILVLWQHLPYGVTHWRLDVLRTWIGPGAMGVDLFFVLSGFLITRILLADKRAGVPLRYFFARRALRIFPIYYLTLAVVYLAWRRPDVLWSAAYLSNFHQAVNFDPSPLRTTWSLSVEEHFYLVWPWVVYLLPVSASRRVAQWVLIPAAVALAAVTVCSIEPMYASALVYRGTMFRIASLSLGGLLAYHETALRSRPIRALTLAAFAVTAGAALVAAGKSHDWTQWQPVTRLGGYALISAALVTGAVLLQNTPKPCRFLLTNRPMRGVGRISYGLYLYHYPIYFALGLHLPRDVYPPSVSTSLLAVCLTFTASTASWFLIEKPVLRLKDRFNGDPRPTQTTQPDRAADATPHTASPLPRAA